ncbi:MAG: cytochrome c [Deltaproteobacteria bacterium]|nr:cytochrome c [Deltaproteobacteria bacterium]
MGRMRSGFGVTVLTGVLAAMMLETGCSDEASAPGSTPAAAPSPPASTSTEGDAAESAAASPAPAAPADTRSPEELAAAGRSTYNANCIACHAMDPRIDGALGPAVAGAPLELIEARVMRAEYPAGYAPKRATRVMVPMPHLQPKLPELAAYLGSLQ